MAKYKVELVFDTVTAGFPGWRPEEIEARMKCVTGVPGPVKVEKLPDPPIKQRFIVEIESPAHLDKVSGLDVYDSLCLSGATLDQRRSIAVTPG